MTEVMMAAVIAVIVTTAVAAALTGGISANRTIKGNEQATALANREVESARNRPFESLVNLTSSLIVEPTGTYGLKKNATGDWIFEPVVGSGVWEPIELGTNTDAIVREKNVTDAVLGLTFKVNTYITRADESSSVTFGSTSNRIRRITTIVSYKNNGARFHARSTTLITRTRRGLPEPKFEVNPLAQTVTAPRGSELVLKHTIRNLGVTDTYDFSAPIASRTSWNNKFKIYADTNASGLFEAADDTPLLDPLAGPSIKNDTNGDNLADTGSVATNGAQTIFVVFAVPPTEPDGAVTISFNVSSGAHSSVFKTVSDVATVGPKTDTYYFYNSGDIANQQQDSDLVGGGSPSVPIGSYPFPMRMDPNRPDNNAPDGSLVEWVHLPDYGADQGVQGPGRPIYPLATTPAFNTVLSASSARYVAAWTKNVTADPTSPGTPTFGPTAKLRLHIANTGGIPCTTDIPIKIYLNRTTTETGTPTSIGAWSAVVPMGATGPNNGGCSFQGVEFGLGITPTAIPVGNWLQVRVALNAPSRTQPALLAYGITRDDEDALRLYSESFLTIQRQ
jgi:hypothetical protein